MRMDRAAVSALWRKWRVEVLGLSVVVLYVRWLQSAGTGDVDIWLGWMRTLDDGLRDAYVSAHRDYPPGSLTLLEVPRMLARTGLIGPLPALKTLLISAALAAAFIVYRWSREPAYALVFLLAVAVNVVAHGYLDILTVPPLLLAMRSLERRRPTAAGAWFATAAAIKWQPLIVGPFVLVEACRTQPSARFGALAGAGRFVIGAVIVAGPLLAFFDPEPIQAALRLALQHSSLSLQGLNANWLVQLAIYLGSNATGALYDVDTPEIVASLARVAFVTTYGCLLWLFIRRGRHFEDYVWYSCLAFYSYCMLNVGVHENHLFLAVILAFVLLCTRHSQAPQVAFFMAVSANVNLLLFYDVDGHGRWTESAPLANPLLLTLSVIASLFNVLLWAVLVYRTVRLRTEPAVLSGRGGMTGVATVSAE
jgi:hypothetical protein